MFNNFKERDSNPLIEPHEQGVESRSVEPLSEFKDNIVSMKNQQDVGGEGEQKEVKADPDYAPSEIVSEDVSDSEGQSGSEELDDYMNFGPNFIYVDREQYFGHQWDAKIVSRSSWKLLNS